MTFRKRPGLFVLALCLEGCGPKAFRERWLKETAPAYFKTMLETTEGVIVLECKRD